MRFWPFRNREREKVLAFIRWEDRINCFYRNDLRGIAAAISRGEHLKPYRATDTRPRDGRDRTDEQRRLMAEVSI